MTTRVLLLAFALFALPTAAAQAEDVLRLADEAVGAANGYIDDVNEWFAPEEPAPPPAEEEAPPHDEGAHEEQHGAHDGRMGHDGRAPEGASESEPARLVPAPLRGLVPVPVLTDGPLPRIDLGMLADVEDIVPLAREGSAPQVTRIEPAATAPTAAGAAPGHASSAATLAPAAIAVAAAATAGGAPSAFSTLWDRLRRVGWLAVLYSRIAKERLLDHGARERLLDAVRAHPGASLADLARMTDAPRNTITYHMRVLEREGLVSSRRQGRHRLFFAPGAIERRDQAEAVATLRHETSRAMALTVGAEPGLDQKALCARVGVSPSLAHWHADRLVTSGVLEKRRDGRCVRYYPGAAFSVVSS